MWIPTSNGWKEDAKDAKKEIWSVTHIERTVVGLQITESRRLFRQGCSIWSEKWWWLFL